MASKAGSELRAIFTLCWPTCCCSMLLFSFQFVNMIGAGQMGTETLAAVSLANSFFNIVSYFAVGAATSIDTLVSQAYGRKAVVECQAWLVRALVIFTLACIPLCGVLAAAAPIFRAFGLAADLVDMAELYIFRLLPGTPCFILFNVLQKYQQSMNIMIPALAVLFFSNLLNVGATMWVVKSGDISSLAWVLTAVRVLTFFLMAGALITLSPEWRSCRIDNGKTERPIKLWSWTPVRRLLLLSFAGAFMTGLEACAFEATVLAAAKVGQNSLDAHNVLLQCISLFYLAVPLGISVAATIRVGNLLGDGEAQLARLSAHLCVAIGTTFMLVSGTGLIVMRHSLGHAFTSDRRVIAKVASVAPVAACFQIIDGFQGVSAGVMRAIGQQAFLAKSIFVAFYCVALPFGFWLCFGLQWGILGLWISLALGLALMAIVYGHRVFWGIDWLQEAHCASDSHSPSPWRKFSSPLLATRFSGMSHEVSNGT
eukprot:CAMPEP_0172749164 /NCGR_PEP_ID=MMETSP1074-20121228/146682_1 /TAXON_ID=2916 /ORGANISM="Ceratium fusus, Strain PA161109" /LENGTH=482 /DNA_ID=CAMNT_0013581059 /DNA_START=35 /DNA_END=1483 /DNA_ORIENTATION=-